MSDALIHVIQFKQKLNSRGKTEDWVLYAPRDDVQNTQTWERVDRLRPPETYSERKGAKVLHMRAVWSQIEPRYEAWRNGHEIPETGTPLGVWPAISPEQAEALRTYGLKTVEDVQELSRTDAAIQRVRLPGIRDLVKQAGAFLEAREGADLAAKLAESEARMAAMQEQLDALSKPKRGRPPKEEAA